MEHLCGLTTKLLNWNSISNSLITTTSLKIKKTVLFIILYFYFLWVL